MKKLFALALAMVMTLSLASCGGKAEPAPGTPETPSNTEKPADPITISISHSYTELDQVSVELNAAKKNIEERTNGAVLVNLYPNNTFGNLVDGVEAVMADSPLMLMAAYSQWEDLYFDASALQCGFVFEKGEEFLKAAISVDEGASYFGEVALVPYDSPISNQKILFYNTLFDENASCHLAFGEAYPECIEGGESMTREEVQAHGLNYSLTHVDFMIGTADLSIVGTTHDGREIPVFINGNFAI